MKVAQLTRVAADDADDADAASARLALDLVRRFVRAIQRATIYPPGHPSIAPATAPFAQALQSLLATMPRVVVGVTSDRLLVGPSSDAAMACDVPWLSARLASRDISEIRFDAGVSSHGAERLVAWLAAGDAAAGAQQPPSIGGVQVTFLDFAGLRFKEGASTGDATDTAVVAWRNVTRRLAGDWFGTGGDAPLDPTDLARYVLHMVDQFEGAGLRHFDDRVSRISADLTALPPDARAAIKLRLAEFMSALSPELRAQILKASPSGDPGKLRLLGEMIDQLPRPDLLEVIRHLEFTRGGSTSQFISFMLKLSTVAAAHPPVAAALQDRFDAEGLPPDLVSAAPSVAERVLSELLARRDDDAEDVAPELYQERLEQLSATSLPAVMRVDASRHVDPRKPEDMAGHVTQIALRIVATCGATEERRACLERLETQLPTLLAAGRFDLLAEAADAFSQASRGDAAQRFFAKPDTIRAVLGAVHEAGGEPPDALVTLARAGGSALAQALLEAITNLIDPRTPGPFHGLLEVLDPDTVRDALTRIYRTEPSVGRELLGAFAALGEVAGVAESARAFLADSDVNVRLDAYQLLFRSDLSPSRFESLLQRALADKDARVTDLALDRAAHATPLVGARALGAFIGAVPTPSTEPRQCRAVRLLAEAASRESIAVLTNLLAARHTSFHAASRRVSRVMADALATSSDATAVAAARAWQRSPAGLLSRVRGDSGGGA